jgi:hypothetical protein
MYVFYAFILEFVTCSISIYWISGTYKKKKKKKKKTGGININVQKLKFGSQW